ncbi:hypothetical protein MYX07_05595 [Patescibacteria group bacterium AH-259-L07]|nr:hypothetical protein [Patescibacteria group bacterium AH-259-L07]
MSPLSFLILWAISGLLTYGLVKGDLKKMYSTDKDNKGYNGDDEFGCILMGITGMLGLLSTVVYLVVVRHFCFSMPKSLREGSRE